MQFNFELYDIHREQVLKTKIPICLNLAAVRLSYGNYESALELCKEVIKYDDKN